MTYGYDADTKGPNPLSHDTLYNVAQTMLAHLSSVRENTDVSMTLIPPHDLPSLLTNTKTTTRPIIFIVHSLGGLVLKNVSSFILFSLGIPSDQGNRL